MEGKGFFDLESVPWRIGLRPLHLGTGDSFDVSEKVEYLD